MESGELRRSQWNALFGILERTGLDPGEFRRGLVDGDWLSVGGEPTPALIHEPSGSLFSIGILPETLKPRQFRGEGSGPFSIYYSPAQHATRGDLPWVNWDTVLHQFKLWLHRIHEDRVSDRWEAFERERQLILAAAEPEENTPFTDAERAQVSAALDEILAEVRRTQRLSAEQDARLVGEIARLKDAATRWGRKDWVNLLLTSAVALLGGAAFAPDQARAYMRIAMHALHWLFTVPPTLLAP